MQNTDNETESMQVTVCNIKWSNPKGKTKIYSLPTEMTLNIPDGVIDGAKKSKKMTVDDAIETFCCNVLTSKFGAEVHRCQIYLPLE